MEHRRLAERNNGNVDDRARLIKPGILEMTDDEGIVALALRLHGVANNFPRAAEFDDRMRVIVVRRDAFDIDMRALVHHRRKMTAQRSQ